MTNIKVRCRFPGGTFTHDLDKNMNIGAFRQLIRDKTSIEPEYQVSMLSDFIFAFMFF